MPNSTMNDDAPETSNNRRQLLTKSPTPTSSKNTNTITNRRCKDNAKYRHKGRHKHRN
jgi:hypothetical protein